jgi:hypothetical protein
MYEDTPFSGLGVQDTLTSLPERSDFKPVSRDGLDASSMIVATVVLLVSVIS